jgi:putative endonuclease
MSTNWDTGRAGETQASQYYQEKGYTIVAHNYQYYSQGRGRKGEIDIIATRDNVICFVEVKTRTNQRFGPALSQITPAKIRALQGAIAYFLIKHRQYQDYFPRIDIATIQNGVLSVVENSTP